MGLFVVALTVPDDASTVLFCYNSNDADELERLAADIADQGARMGHLRPPGWILAEACPGWQPSVEP